MPEVPPGVRHSAAKAGDRVGPVRPGPVVPLGPGGVPTLARVKVVAGGVALSLLATVLLGLPGSAWNTPREVHSSVASAVGGSSPVGPRSAAAVARPLTTTTPLPPIDPTPCRDWMSRSRAAVNEMAVSQSTGRHSSVIRSRIIGVSTRSGWVA